jgi:murein DD-endopeptidase MepM/ murein hydrolase activator NlpD
MIRLFVAATGLVVIGGAAAGTGTAAQAARSALSPPLAPDAPGVTVTDAPGHAATLHAPPGTPLLAVSEGNVTQAGSGGLTVRGTGDDAGLEVRYGGLPAPITAGPVVQRGDALDAAPTTPAVVTISATLDGRVLDIAPLLRAALRGVAGDTGEWNRPVDGAVVTQGFGCTPYAFEPVDRSCASGHVHTGIDLAVPLGTPVHAALDGTVHVVVSTTGYGVHVILDHGGGLTTLYAHLESVTVHDGDEVDGGDVIGLAGSTGNSTGPHLHFEVRRDGVTEDPNLDVALP